MLKAFKNLARFRRESKFSTWLIQITINEAKMKLRKDRRHLYEAIENGHRNDDGDYIPTDFADWREIPSEALEQAELREALQKALQTLPEKYRTVLILRDVPLDGALADRQRLRDGCVALPGGDVREHFVLAGCQRPER